jgi:hypothetical protein
VPTPLNTTDEILAQLTDLMEELENGGTQKVPAQNVTKRVVTEDPSESSNSNSDKNPNTTLVGKTKQQPR